MYRLFFKRFFDFCISVSAVLLLSPILLMLTILGTIEMRGNPFYVQKRPGKRNKKTGQEKIIKLIKFRSMTNEKDANGKLLPDKDRLNKYGRIIRATSLDELPSLINIVKGDISIVGPRPLAVIYLKYYTKEERHRHDVRPGLTGLAQVNGRNNLTWEEKFTYDLEYVKNVTFVNDIKIILKTIRKVISHEVIEQGEERPMSLHIELKDWILSDDGAIPQKIGVDTNE